MEDFGVIEQEHDHIDFDVDCNEGKCIIDDKTNQNINNKNINNKNINSKNKENTQGNERCKFIKKNGKQCRQRGKENQSGGPILNGYCKYHRHLP